MGSIKDKTAIIGMGCTRFGNHHDRDLEDLVVEAVGSALEEARLKMEDVDCFYWGCAFSGMSGINLSSKIKVNKPVTRLENYCATGSEAVRNACYAVASGVFDIAVAVGGEKLNDSGYSGLIVPPDVDDRTLVDMTTPAMFNMLAVAYSAKYDIPHEELRKALIRVAYKNHRNGALNPKAMFRSEVPENVIAQSPIIAAPFLTIMDCSGISDGAAAAVITRADLAHKYTEAPMYVKAAQLIATSGKEEYTAGYNFTELTAAGESARRAYAEAGIVDPVSQLDSLAVHDCFTITEIILYEELGISKRGEGWKDVLQGKFDHDGKVPVNIDGGLKAFGHPIGASGIRMLYEFWLQFKGEAGQRQLKAPRLAAAQNLGGAPYKHVSSFVVVGNELG